MQEGIESYLSVGREEDAFVLHQTCRHIAGYETAQTRNDYAVILQEEAFYVLCEDIHAAKVELLFCPQRES